jgi:hypothetical protein
MRTIKNLFYSCVAFLLVSTPSFAQGLIGGSRGGGSGNLVGDINVDGSEGGQLIKDIFGAILDTGSATGILWQAGCYACIIVTLLLGLKQFFIKSDEQERGGFFSVIKIGGWAFAGALGLWIQNFVAS